MRRGSTTVSNASDRMRARRTIPPAPARILIAGLADLLIGSRGTQAYQVGAFTFLTSRCTPLGTLVWRVVDKTRTAAVGRVAQLGDRQGKRRGAPPGAALASPPVRQTRRTMRPTVRFILSLIPVIV